MYRSFIAILPLLTGCYSYSLIQTEAAQPGTDVRAHITPAAAQKLAPLLGASDMQSLAGRLEENGPGGLIVEVPSVIPRQNGGSVQTLSQRIAIARVDLIDIETRTRDNLRTGLLAGGVAGAIGAAALVATRGESSSGTTRPGGGVELRIPLIRITCDQTFRFGFVSRLSVSS